MFIVGNSMCAQLLSRVWLFATPWTIACQAPLCMGFSKQEYWSRLPFPSPNSQTILHISQDGQMYKYTDAGNQEDINIKQKKNKT